MTAIDVLPALDHVLADGAVTSVFQPIVDLVTGAVVAHEALARGPEGPLHSPAVLFGAARAQGRLAELDAACRVAAFDGAVRHGILAPTAVFVNVEPEVLVSASLDDLLGIADRTPGGLRVVLEITERALARRPAELMQAVARVRDVGWGVALDDVGAEPASLAFMELLQPDVVKLDLQLVQDEPTAASAHVMSAVNAYAERSGALVLAEGIETEQHVRNALSLGATLGQGWLFGRPSAPPSSEHPISALLPEQLEGRPRRALRDVSHASPFACLPPDAVLRSSTKSLLVELSKHLEREALRLGESCVVLATFQHARHFTARTQRRYTDLVQRTGFVAALGADLPVEPLPGLRGGTLAPGDPVLNEWDLVVLSPHFSAALLARDLGDGGPDGERRFEYALTYHRYVVVAAATSMMSRIAESAAAAT